MSDTPENIVITPSLTGGAMADPAGGPGPNDPLPGTTLGDYVVQKVVAWGGMGIVYRAVHPLIGRHVAVKVLRPNFAADPEQMSRFLKEAQAIASIKHRGIIDIIGFGRIPPPDGRQYMVMEFLEGESLEALMLREKRMSAGQTLEIADELLDALSAAHRVGVIHRDLKPANVFITRQSNGRTYVKLVDFGLARVADPAALGRHSGRASVMAGTPEYVSPEQAKGLAATPRTDLYCLGVMLFEMLTGRLPFLGTGMLDLLNAHVNETAPRVSSLVSETGPALDELIAQLLLKVPTQRPSSADVVRQRVQRIIRELNSSATAIVTIPVGLRAAAPTDEKTTVDRTPTTDRALIQTAEAAPPTSRNPPVRIRRKGLGLWFALAALGGLTVAVGWFAQSRPSPTEPPLVVAPLAPLDPQVTQPPAPSLVVPDKTPPAPTEKPDVAPVAPRPKVKPTQRPEKAAPGQPARVSVSIGAMLDKQRVDADVEVDGMLRGSTPLTLELTPGPHEFRISRPGGKTLARTANIDGQTRSIVFDFSQ